jgi:hypothetical protein
MAPSLPKFTSSISQISRNWLTLAKAKVGVDLRQLQSLGIDLLGARDLGFKSRAKFWKISGFKAVCKRSLSLKNP